MTKEKAMSNGMIHNSIAANTRIVGTITAENDFRVDGIIEGEIICQGKVIIGQTANVKGKLTCTNAEIVGRMDGEIKVSEILTLKSTAVVTGDMKIATLVVEPNAKFDGTCSMITDKA
ncbi:MAG: polymer-forming cytoskeletal protein [Bacteroidales bacterium]|nr:polymer-forming cytoskeletal protein [Bacteroidales bacterium]MBO7271213.1 polymer-forming cytoskeletal protein [Bacteroidales bacterium]